MLMFEGFQAGLFRLTILRKRQVFREAFQNCERIASGSCTS